MYLLQKFLSKIIKQDGFVLTRDKDSRKFFIGNPSNAKPLEVAEPDIQKSEEREFSFLRAIRASATGDWRDAGYEREVSDEIAKQSNRTPKGFFAPASAWGQRNIIAGVNADGGFLKPTDHYGNEFISALRSRLVVGGLGVSVMSGLQGDISIPKISAGVSATFVGEGSAVSEVNQKVLGTPAERSIFVSIQLAWV